jgi:hypothetical protein
MLLERLLLTLASLAPASLLLATSLPPAGWDWPATGQLVITCVVETNASGLASRVISLDPGRSTLRLPPAQLTLRCRPGNQTWSGPQAWDLPVLSIGVWQLQVLDGQGRVLSDTSGGPLRVPASNLLTAGLPQGPTQGPVTVDVLAPALAGLDFTPAELKPLVLDYLAAHPTSLPVTGEVKFHVLIPSGATVQVAQDITVEALIVQAGGAVEGGDAAGDRANAPG